jgi:hypothetical protein
MTRLRATVNSQARAPGLVLGQDLRPAPRPQQRLLYDVLRQPVIAGEPDHEPPQRRCVHIMQLTQQRRPSGAVCIYPNASWNGGRPSYVFYSYGGHNLSGHYGTHSVFNYQYGAKAWVCWGYNGTDCRWKINEWTFSDVNLTPINSIKLTAS